MKKLLTTAFIILVSYSAGSGQNQRAQKCRLRVKNTDNSKEIANYYYDRNSNLIAKVIHFAPIGDVLPATKDSELIFYDSKGKADRIIDINDKNDTIEITRFEYTETGRLFKIHTLNRITGNNNIIETSCKEIGEMADNQVKITNYNLEDGKTELQISGYKIVFIKNDGNVETEKAYRPGGNEAIMTNTYAYDNNPNGEYLKIYAGDPLNNNFNNITLSEIKSSNDGLHGTMKTIYEYNSDGYPVKATYMDGEEIYSTVTYSWVCK